ncbi:nuclear transport factor 2 family protein [Erythrobacter alti]|uniref:nuclear transport factor 2 family protein n=1 Tax=Erythrobacter alti TaxID=1896145 RepID=UPI0030F3CD15
MEDRLRRIEHDRAIRDLKMRYLRSADAKDPDAMRDCFAPDAHIAFQGFPDFEDRDSFIDIYRELGCAPGIFDIHQGGTGIIEFYGATYATGWWPLYFHNINLAERTLTQLGVEYDDRYELREGRWWIVESRSRQKSCLIHSIDEDGISKAIAIGEAPGMFGATDKPSD